MLDTLVANAQLFFLIFARILAFLQIAPLISSNSVPQIAKIGLAFFSGFLIFPWVAQAGYPLPDTGLAYAMLLFGEALIGIIMGFFLVVVFAAFQLSGQLFSLQMGFGASQVFDPLAQIEIPLMGQFLNLVAMLVFVTTSGFQKLFLTGVLRSFQALRASDLVTMRHDLVTTMLLRLSRLFEQALVMAFPILGALFLVYVAVGLLAKAAPQMNLLVLGFPISIFVAFLLLLMSLPLLVEAFQRVIDEGFTLLLQIFRAGSVGS